MTDTPIILPSPRIDPYRGPPPHEKGPLVFLDYDQIELDAAYDQAVYQPNILQLNKRWASNSARTRARDWRSPSAAALWRQRDLSNSTFFAPRQVERVDLRLHPRQVRGFAVTCQELFRAGREMFRRRWRALHRPRLHQCVADAGGEACS